ncbi:MAG TPA: response regulator [Roseiflexaceae bacterium]|nr:response regulator [Roseiflexaceae bacterium]
MNQAAPLIYVVEDNSDIRCLLEEALSDAGYRVLGCRTAHEAEFCMQAERPDLVLLDNHLEHYAAGWRLLTQLCGDAATTALPIILMSVDVEFLQEHCVELHAQRCLALEKPFDLDDLLTTVYAALGVVPAELKVATV